MVSRHGMLATADGSARDVPAITDFGVVNIVANYGGEVREIPRRERVHDARRVRIIERSRAAREHLSSI